MYNKIYTITIDEDFAKASGVNVSLYNTLVTILISVTIVIGMKFYGKYVNFLPNYISSFDFDENF